MRPTIHRFLASICCCWQLDQPNRNIDFTPNTHTHTPAFTLACTLPLAVIITPHPLSDSVYWLSGQGLEVLSPITAVRAERDSINVNLVNSGGASGCFCCSQAGKWEQTSKCHLWLLGRLNGLVYIWGEKRTNLIEVGAASGCLAAVNKTGCISVSIVGWIKVNKHKHLFKHSPAHSSKSSWALWTLKLSLHFRAHPKPQIFF